MSEIQKITCPNCSHQFDIENVLAQQIRKEEQAKINSERLQLEKQLREFEEKKKKENELFQDRLSKGLNEQKALVRKEMSEEFQIQIKAQSEELEKRRREGLKLKETQVELEKMKSSMKEQRADIMLEFEKEKRKELDEKEKIIFERLQGQFKEKEAVNEKRIEDQNKLIEEMKRKSEQGSMQMQGEVGELFLEELLKSSFPYDGIAEVPKGISGADVIQTVKNELQEVCGTIVYESKKTKNFSADWIDKLKQDTRSLNGNISVLVTKAKPRDMEGFGEVRGVWVCSFDEVKSLAYVLREMLVTLNSQKVSQENKGDKMGMLYDFLTGPEFKGNILAIVEGFESLKEDLEKEKRAMLGIWKKREKQIEKVTLNTIGLYGSVKGIAGGAISSIHQLELPGGDEDENSDI